MKCFKCVAPLDIPNTVVGPNRFNYANQTSPFVGVVMVKKMNPLLHSIFFHNVSSCEKVFSGYFITWRGVVITQWPLCQIGLRARGLVLTFSQWHQSSSKKVKYNASHNRYDLCLFFVWSCLSGKQPWLSNWSLSCVTQTFCQFFIPQISPRATQLFS